MEKAVVYARYSSHSQTEQSIEGQLHAARRYASDKGYKIVHEYCDRAKTGTNDNRDAFQQMLRDTAKHKFTVIIVWKVDRFGRNREEITFNKYKCKKNGVRVEYIAENISNGPEGVILESVLEGMAEYYSLQLSQNIRRGLYESAKKHQALHGRRPLGYRIGEDKKYIIDEKEAEIVRLIFDMYIEGHSQMEIINYLNSRGYKNRDGKEFKRNAVCRIIHNEKYYGLYRYQDICDEDAIPAIVSKETFMKANKASKVHLRMAPENWNYSEYKLSDKCVCGLCGGSMNGESTLKKKTGKKYTYYLCHKCKKLRKKSEVVDTAVLTELKRLLSDNELIDKISEACFEYYKENDETSKEIERLEEAIKDIEKREQNILKSIENGLSYELCKDRLDALATEKKDLEEIHTDAVIHFPFKLTKDMIKFFILKQRDEKSESALIHEFVNKVVVYEDSIDVYFNYSEGDTLSKSSIDDTYSALNVNVSNHSVYLVGKMFYLKIHPGNF